MHAVDEAHTAPTAAGPHASCAEYARPSAHWVHPPAGSQAAQKGTEAAQHLPPAHVRAAQPSGDAHAAPASLAAQVPLAGVDRGARLNPGAQPPHPPSEVQLAQLPKAAYEAQHLPPAQP